MRAARALTLALAMIAPLGPAFAQQEPERCAAAVAKANSDILSFYPPKARAKGIEGTASISCRSAVFGEFVDCFLVSEAPEGEGFGTAALAIARSVGRKPRITPAPELVGQPKSITLNFKLSPPSISPNLIVSSSIKANAPWLAAPTADDVERAVRETDLPRLRADGVATLSCMVTKEGRMADCLVVSERPTNANVGRGALSMTSQFMMEPVTASGCSVEGSETVFATKFVLH